MERLPLANNASDTYFARARRAQVFSSYVSNFCVRETHRRNRLGSMLMACASTVYPSDEQEGAGAGRKHHRVYAHVSRANNQALGFYKKNGFREAKAEAAEGAVSATVSDMICLVKSVETPS